MAQSELQQELGKRDPFEFAEQEAHLNLLRTQDFLIQEFERLFNEHGISAPQYNLLRILRGHGGAGLPCLEIAKNMIHRMPDITRLADRLEQAGLIERRRTQEDRHVVLITITQTGLDLLSRLDDPVLAVHKRQLGHLTAAELAELNRLLVKARRGTAQNQCRDLLEKGAE